MRKKILFAVFLGIFLFSFVFAQQPSFCVDLDPPSSPSNLAVSGKVGNIVLIWEPATDEPNCSGVDYYNVARNGDEIGNTSFDVLTFIDKDNLNPGSYNYTVYAVDKVGHNEGASKKNDVFLSEPTGGGGSVSGGGGGTSYTCYEEWQCTGWTACVNEIQTRTCTDLERCGTTKLKPATTRACSVEEAGEEDKGVEILGEEETQGFLAGITGAVIGGGTGSIIGVIIFIALIAGISTYVYKKRKKD